MRIDGVAHLHQAHGIKAPHNASLAAKPESAESSGSIDKLELSAAAQEAADAGEVRSQKIAEIRSQIEAGTYDTADKLDRALDRFLDTLA